MLVPDTWLSERLQKEAFTLQFPHDLTERFPPHSLVTCHAPVDDIALVRTLTVLGFHLITTSVTLTRSGYVPIIPLRSLTVRDAIANDYVLPGIQWIGHGAFTHDRFHRDPLISDEIANVIKRDWVVGYRDASWERDGKKALVATRFDDPLGFLLMKRDGPAVRLDLIGLAPLEQGYGIGTTLVIRFLRECVGRDAIVSTQLSNVRSLRLYAGLDFRITASAYVMHQHTL